MLFTVPSSRIWLLLVAVSVLLLAAGCTSIGNMQDQAKLETYDGSEVFGSAARQLDPNAVPVGYLRDEEHFYAGTVDGALAETFPVDVTEDLILEGRRQFESFCVPCHGYSGYGDGVLVQEGFTAPPSYHDPELRNQPVGHYFDVITNGQGDMFSYASRVAPEDRWAIVAYIRALQLSQNATADDLPDAIQAQVAASDAAPETDADAADMGQMDG